MKNDCNLPVLTKGVYIQEESKELNFNSNFPTLYSVPKSLPRHLGEARSIMRGHDLTQISPIQLLELSNELFQSNLIGFEDFATIALQPELNPGQYLKDRGAPPNPVLPKNIIQDFHDQLALEKAKKSPQLLVQKLEQTTSLLENLQSLNTTFIKA